MKEIGGYFQLEHLYGAEYHQDLLRLNLGRTALVYALQTLHVKKLYLPRFVCDSVTSACRQTEHLEILWYSIREDFTPILPESIEEDAWIFLINYYGQLSNDTLRSLKEKYHRIIADYTHCFFRRPVREIPTLYSCRKYFGLPDGAYLSLPETPDDFYQLPMDQSKYRMAHILGRYEQSASDFYSSMLETAHSFYDEPVKQMSPLTQNLLHGIDYSSAQRQRNENYDVIAQLLGDQNPLKLHREDGPFVYPFYHPDAGSLKKELAKQHIFVPTYWNNVIDELPSDTLEWDYASHIMPLPIDQRYTAEDIRYVAETLKKLL